MPEDIALFIDFENIRYSMLNIQRREPDPQELIAVARRYGTVMVARAYADWSRQPEPFKGSLTAAMIDRVDCPAKQRDRIRIGTVHYTSSNPPIGVAGAPGSEQTPGRFPQSPLKGREMVGLIRSLPIRCRRNLTQKIFCRQMSHLPTKGTERLIINSMSPHDPAQHISSHTVNHLLVHSPIAGAPAL
jgi:NYN domain